MIQRTAIIFMSLVLMLAATMTVVSAHHSYLLSVQQLRAGLTKAPSMTQKGFVLIDVRSPEEHAGGFIPGTDFNIDFREIKTRHREIGVHMDEHVVVYCQSGHRSNIAAKRWRIWDIRMCTMSMASMNAWVEAGFPVTR